MTKTERFTDRQTIRVQNLSAFWIPELTLKRQIGGTLYTVTGSYDGKEMLNKKICRLLPDPKEVQG